MIDDGDKRKKILVSNDDGIYSEGLTTLAKALESLGDVFVVAPDRERSAVSHSLTLHRPLRVKKITSNIFSIDGTPTDCVNLSLNGILPVRPDLVVSGINVGANLGDDITYSGTVSAAMEGTLFGIPSFAISLACEDIGEFEIASHYAVKVADIILMHGLPKDTLLNINVPSVKADDIKGVKFTKQGKKIYSDAIVEKVDPRGKKYYWIGGNRIDFEHDEETDLMAVSENYVSITPLHLDLTNYASFKELLTWEL
jgi:5'-nucleotidase